MSTGGWWALSLTACALSLACARTAMTGPAEWSMRFAMLGLLAGGMALLAVP